MADRLVEREVGGKGRTLERAAMEDIGGLPPDTSMWHSRRRM